MMLSTVELERYRLAGRITAQALAHGRSLVRPGLKVIDLCEAVERLVVEKGAIPAFPCNVSINSVAAHYSSPLGDESVIPDRSVVKLDIGARVDGCIADSAVTVCLARELADMQEAAEAALANALNTMKPGVKLSEVGRVIGSTIKGYGFKPIRNLQGHLIKPFNLHAGKSVPNYPAGGSDRIVEGEVYAVEPFSTNGAGMVKDMNIAYIYRMLAAKKLKSEIERQVVGIVNDEFQGLPFVVRWLAERLRLSHAELQRLVDDLRRKHVFHAYPVLREADGGLVAQAEHTVIIERDGVRILTGVQT